MKGFGVKLPLSTDPIDGAYALLKDATESIKQNLKMIVLTSPGERIFRPDFGAGIRKALFEQNTELNRSDLQKRIANQIARSAPYINVFTVTVTNGEPDSQALTDSTNSIYIKIEYSIPSLNNYQDYLEIEITNNSTIAE
jgi:phage baseplate assembly protein W